jgi:rod shape-determining protein MreD
VRNLAFLAGGLALLIVQANLFRVIEGLPLVLAVLAWLVAAAVDASRGFRSTAGHPRAITPFRADFTLPATVLLAYVATVAVGRVHVTRPIPALVLPLILYMGVHEYSLARGAAVAFVLGYATDLLGIAPVGLYTFTYVATFVLSRAVGVRLAAQTTWMQVLLVGAFSILQSTMLLVLLAIFGRDVWVPRSLYPLALPHAIATAAVAPLIFRMAQALDGAAGNKPRAESGAAAGMT